MKKRKGLSVLPLSKRREIARKGGLARAKKRKQQIEEAERLALSPVGSIGTDTRE